MAKLSLFRYRRPGIKTTLGITKMKKRMNKQLGTTAVKAPFRAPGTMKRRMLRKVGYYSGPMKFIRFLGRISKKRGEKLRHLRSVS